MKITDALTAEHAVLRRLFDHADQHLEPWGLAELRAAGANTAAALLAHAAIEDEILFNALAPRVGEQGPVAVMRDEHEQIDAAFARLDAATDAGEARKALRLALRLTRGHFSTEEGASSPPRHRREPAPRRRARTPGRRLGGALQITAEGVLETPMNLARLPTPRRGAWTGRLRHDRNDSCGAHPRTRPIWKQRTGDSMQLADLRATPALLKLDLYCKGAAPRRLLLRRGRRRPQDPAHPRRPRQRPRADPARRPLDQRAGDRALRRPLALHRCTAQRRRATGCAATASDVAPGRALAAARVVRAARPRAASR